MIEIKHRWTGEVLFTSSKETAKEAVIEALSVKANLRGADLRGADLRGADLRGADFWEADFWGANLRGADLRGADFWGANFWGADLRGADFWGANFWGANLRGGKIKKAVVFSGLYRYVVIAYETEAGELRVKMGCHDRSVAEWDADFWNNDNEFPNNGSYKSECRKFAYETAKRWFNIRNLS